MCKHLLLLHQKKGYACNSECSYNYSVIRPNCFQMPCWYYDKKELRNTPSARDGIDYATEARYRKEGARFIIDCGTKLGLYPWNFCYQSFIQNSLEIIYVLFYQNLYVADLTVFSRYDSCATGVVFFHRFYMFHSFKEFHRYVSIALFILSFI